MLLYMGRSSALAMYHRDQKVRRLTECAAHCGVAFHRFAEQIESAADSQARDCLASGIKAAGDCLELCSLTASLIGRESELSSFALPVCAEACRQCAEACDEMSPDHMTTECASQCRHAERVCRQAFGPRESWPASGSS